MTFETELDTSDLNELGRAAVWYCENGFAIIPIVANGKRPFAKVAPNGLKDCFDNPEDARKVWTIWPDLNIAVVCGSVSGNLVVIDFDIDEGSGKDGTSTLGMWEDETEELAPTATAITGSGGMHYLYRSNRAYHPSVNADLGVDIRAEGSYIIVPPSIHPNGNLYQWNDGDAPWEREITEVDSNVAAFIDYVQRNGGIDQDAPTPERFELPQRIKRHARNDTIYRYGCSLRHRGLPDDAIGSMLREANTTRCIPPMSDAEVSGIIKQVCKLGAGHNGQGTMLGDTDGIGKPGTSSADVDEFPQFRKVSKDGKPGPIQHNLLARGIMECDHARKIDGSLAVWTGKRWEFGVNAIKMMCTHHADDIKESTRMEVVKYINTSERLLSVSSDNSFDGGYYVQFANGTWDVLAQQFVEPNHQMYIVGTLPIELDLDAPYGLADQFIQSISDEDENIGLVLCEIIGACMCNRRIISQALMLVGRANGVTAANGKSTYIKAVKSLIGPKNVSTLDVGMFGKPFFVGDLVGKLANLGDDIPASYLNGDEASMWKRSVTGETIKADVKYGDAFDFNPSAVQMFSMNVIPRLSAEDDGLYRRLAFIPFKRHFEPGQAGYDKDMSLKLARTENLQRLAVLGLMALPDLIQRGKLTEIPEMVQELEDVRTSNDAVRRWIVDQYITDADLAEQWASEIFAEYKKWAIEANENVFNQATFTKRVLATLATLEVYTTRDRSIDKSGRKFRFKR